MEGVWLDGGAWLDGGLDGGGLTGWRGPGWMELTGWEGAWHGGGLAGEGWRGLAGWRAWLDDGWRGPGWMEGFGRREGRSLVRVDGRCLRGGGAGWRDGWSGSAVRFERFVSRVGAAVCGFLRFTGLNGSWRFGSGLRFGSRPSC